MRVTFADIGGIPTRYYHAGAGYPLLLIHGAGMSADCWLRNIDALGADFQVFAPDVLGQGFTGSGAYTGGPPHPWMIDHLLAFVDHLGLDRFIAAGSSFGALLAGLLYFRRPDRVDALVFGSSGSAVNHEGDSDLQGAYRNGLTVIDNPTPEHCRKRLERIFFDPASVPAELAFIQATIAALPGARESYERRMRGMMQFEACRPYRIDNRLAQIAVPTLLIWGREDPRGRYDRAQEALQVLPRGTLVTIDRCKHHPHIEHADRFNAAVRDFALSAVRSRPDARAPDASPAA